MTWIIKVTGSPQAIVEALEATSRLLDGESKAEFDSVRPGLATLVVANAPDRVLTLDANGRGQAGAVGSTCQAQLFGSGIV